MKGERIFRIPFWYMGYGVRAKHRNDEAILLRDVVPVAFETMDVADAPMRLRAELRRDGEPYQLLELKHDGSGYLRPAGGLSGGDVREIGVADLDAFETAYGEDLPKADLPPEWLHVHHDRLRDTSGRFGRYTPCDEVEILDTISMRSWKSCDTEEARAAAVRSCSQFALVGGVLHRRVPVPKWTAPHGQPQITGGEAVRGTTGVFAPKSYGPIIPIWPIRLAAVVAEYSEQVQKAAGGPRWDFSCDAPLETDVDRDCLEIAQLLLPPILPYVNAALHDVSDAGLDVYKDFRVAADACLDGDPAAARVAMDKLLTISADPGRGGPRNELDGLVSAAKPHLRRWLSITTAFDREAVQENEAIGELAAL